jgi:hypothetical protein
MPDSFIQVLRPPCQLQRISVVCEGCSNRPLGNLIATLSSLVNVHQLVSAVTAWIAPCGVVTLMENGLQMEGVGLTPARGCILLFCF